MKKLFAILIALFPLVETFADESPQQEPKGDALTISTEVRASVCILISQFLSLNDLTHFKKCYLCNE